MYLSMKLKTNQTHVTMQTCHVAAKVYDHLPFVAEGVTIHAPRSDESTLRAMRTSRGVVVWLPSFLQPGDHVVKLVTDKPEALARGLRTAFSDLKSTVKRSRRQKENR